MARNPEGTLGGLRLHHHRVGRTVYIVGRPGARKEFTQTLFEGLGPHIRLVLFSDLDAETTKIDAKADNLAEAGDGDLSADIEETLPSPQQRPYQQRYVSRTHRHPRSSSKAQAKS